MEEKKVEGKKPVRQIVIARLKAGEQPFLAWGYSKVKGTQLVEDPNNPGEMVEEEVELKIPIKSVGVSEVADRMLRHAPVPPVVQKLVKKNSPEAKELGLTHDKFVDHENTTDPAYKEAVKNYNQRLVYMAVLAGLSLDIEDGDGNKVVESVAANRATKINDEDKAIAILKEQGISNAQFDQIYEDIQNLTRKEKERVDQE